MRQISLDRKNISSHIHIYKFFETTIVYIQNVKYTIKLLVTAFYINR